jgi:exodeoxyribonuclease VII large subunit
VEQVMPTSTLTSLDEGALSVSDLTLQIKALLRSKFSPVTVRGEISNLKRQASGHIYFSLKDTNSQISCALFKGSALKLNINPKEGDEVIAIGSVDVYGPRGQYQLIVSSMRAAGLGALLVKLQKLKEKLKALGYFDIAHKKQLPKFPKKIAVITSPTGAVIRDIIHVLKRRTKAFDLLVCPVSVQGDACPLQVSQMIETVNQHHLADVIIVARGGGSIEDLYGFNSEEVAKAIFESQIPIISAVGHETDTTIADCVADVRAPTPSAAAEIVLGETIKYEEKLSQIQKTLHSHVAYRLSEAFSRLKRYSLHPLFASKDLLLSQFIQKNEALCAQLDLKINQIFTQKEHAVTVSKERLNALQPKNQIFTFKARLARAAYSLKKRPDHISSTFSKRLISIQRQLTGNLEASLTTLKEKRKSLIRTQDHLSKLILKLTTTKKERLEILLENLTAVDPRTLMKKGYALVFSQKTGSIILSKETLDSEGTAKLKMHDGETIIEVKPN